MQSVIKGFDSHDSSALISNAQVAQLVEAQRLGRCQCGFESLLGHQVKGNGMYGWHPTVYKVWAYFILANMYPLILVERIMIFVYNYFKR